MDLFNLEFVKIVWNMYGKSNKKLLSNEKLRLLLKCKKHLSQQQIGAKNHTIKTSFFEKK